MIKSSSCKVNRFRHEFINKTRIKEKFEKPIISKCLKLAKNWIIWIKCGLNWINPRIWKIKSIIKQKTKRWLKNW